MMHVTCVGKSLQISQSARWSSDPPSHHAWPWPAMVDQYLAMGVATTCCAHIFVMQHAAATVHENRPEKSRIGLAHATKVRFFTCECQKLIGGRAICMARHVRVLGTVANPTFCTVSPNCIGTTFCPPAALLCMSTSNSEVCHISHNLMCAAFGQVLAQEALQGQLPPLSTFFINVVCSCCFAVRLLSAQMRWTCPSKAPALSTFPCQIAFLLDWGHPSPSPRSPISTTCIQGPSLCPGMMLHIDLEFPSCFNIFFACQLCSCHPCSPCKLITCLYPRLCAPSFMSLEASRCYS
jgi:hypothetical protein